MDEELKQAVIEHLGSRVSAVGFAPVGRFENEPEKHPKFNGRG